MSSAESARSTSARHHEYGVRVDVDPDRGALRQPGRPAAGGLPHDHPTVLQPRLHLRERAEDGDRHDPGARLPGLAEQRRLWADSERSRRRWPRAGLGSTRRTMTVLEPAPIDRAASDRMVTSTEPGAPSMDREA